MARYAKVWIVCGFAAGLIVNWGCDSTTTTSNGPSMDEITAQLDAQKTAQQQAEAANATQQAQPAAQPPAEPERKVAGREGVGEGGYYTAIVGARRHVLNKVEGLGWTTSVRSFQATNGRLPKDHAEFMTIIEQDGVDLGYKEENQEFLYDPSEGQFGTLYVVEKETAPAPAQ
jgi:hypothetical protein